MEAQDQIDEELKVIFMDYVFSKLVHVGSPDDQLKHIAECWDLLYNSINNRCVYYRLIQECEVLGLPWHTYDFSRYEFFMDDWEMEIKARLFNFIKEHYGIL